MNDTVTVTICNFKGERRHTWYWCCCKTPSTEVVFQQDSIWNYYILCYSLTVATWHKLYRFFFICLCNHEKDLWQVSFKRNLVGMYWNKPYGFRCNCSHRLWIICRFCSLHLTIDAYIQRLAGIKLCFISLGFPLWFLAYAGTTSK